MASAKGHMQQQNKNVRLTKVKLEIVEISKDKEDKTHKYYFAIEPLETSGKFFLIRRDVI